MGKEIERKFLVKDDTWRVGAKGTLYRQGYLSTAPERTVRIRTAGDQGVLTVKGRSEGATRAEFEYSIPDAEAREMLDTLCLKPLIEKTRHCIEWAGLVWDVDEFHGDNAGLILAEVELTWDLQKVDLPPWAGQEVTGDRRYYNANLIENPFFAWDEASPERA